MTCMCGVHAQGRGQGVERAGDTFLLGKVSGAAWARAVRLLADVQVQQPPLNRTSGQELEATVGWVLGGPLQKDGRQHPDNTPTSVACLLFCSVQEFMDEVQDCTEVTGANEQHHVVLPSVPRFKVGQGRGIFRSFFNNKAMRPWRHHTVLPSVPRYKVRCAWEVLACWLCPARRVALPCVPSSCGLSAAQHHHLDNSKAEEQRGS